MNDMKFETYSLFFSEVATEYIGTIFYMAAIFFMVTHIFAEVM